jgi:hypothetical protein
MAIISLGVTGHRFLSEMDAVMAGVDSALQRILETFPSSDFRVLSSLAEGADRIIVKKFLAFPDTALWVPLPLPEEEFLRDFETSASKQEFMHLLGEAEKVITLSVTGSREDAYLAAGKYILDHCDLLVAVWDGEPAQGPAGTSAIVALGRQRGLPMAWIHAGNNNHGQGEVTFEHFPPLGVKA